MGINYEIGYLSVALCFLMIYLMMFIGYAHEGYDPEECVTQECYNEFCCSGRALYLDNKIARLFFSYCHDEEFSGIYEIYPNKEH